jgi:sugar (pentulose or hexulose) kinase
MIRDDVWIGIDLGTQSVRVLAVRDDGVPVGAGSRPLTGRRDGVRHEQDPEHWWQSVGGSCRDALRDVDPAAVRGVAVTSTSGTVLLADPSGTPLTPALMYDDGRAADRVPLINEIGAKTWTELGYQRVQPAWALPKVLWLLDQHVGGEVRLQHQNDFVNHRLVGHEVAADLSSALKTGAHLIQEDWPHEVFEALAIPEELLPPLVRSGTPLGTVCAQAAAETGLPAGTLVLAGSTDGCAAQLGAGPLRVGDWNSVLGTTLVVKGVTRDLVRDPSGTVYSHRAPDGSWLPGGASSTGAGVISREFPDDDLDVLDHLAVDHLPCDQIAYPLVSAGERFPFAAPEARGFTIGEAGSPAEHFAALLQGVALVERLCFDHLDLLGAPVDGGTLTLTGGASRSRQWCQLRADVLGRPVTLPENAEPALGMAVLAAGHSSTVAHAASRMVRMREVLEPTPGSSGRYDDHYSRLVTELADRGWLGADVARHAEQRTNR